METQITMVSFVFFYLILSDCLRSFEEAMWQKGDAPKNWSIYKLPEEAVQS